jgi:FSR family fosmidomycin resistance protein-like MFS transporter
MSVTSGAERLAPSVGNAKERRRRTLVVAGLSHALHDGFTDLLYILLPIWQAEFGLGYAAVGTLRALYSGTMAGFQVPATGLAGRLGGAMVLAAGTAVAAAGYLLAGASSGFALLAAALIIGGLGSSTQHPIASSLVASGFEGASSRAALGTYNFAGDLGKMAVPAATAVLVSLMPWRSAVTIIGLVGLLIAVAIHLSLRQTRPAPISGAAEPNPKAADLSPVISLANFSFLVLLTIGIIDSATRMGFLTFLPFLLKAKGADLPTIGLALTLVFAGGAAGKLVCGFLGARLGVVATVCLTEGVTALIILALLPVSLAVALARNRAEWHIFGALWHRARAGPGRKADARLWHLLYRGHWRRGAVPGVIRVVQRRRRRRGDDAANRRRCSDNIATRLSVALCREAEMMR